MQDSKKRWSAQAFGQPNQQESKRKNETTINTYIYIDVWLWAFACLIVQKNCETITQAIAQAITQAIAQAIARAMAGANFFFLFLKNCFSTQHKIKLSQNKKTTLWFYNILMYLSYFNSAKIPSFHFYWYSHEN